MKNSFTGERTVHFEGKTYWVKSLYLPNGDYVSVAEKGLEDCLKKDGIYVSDEAKAIDEDISYYLDVEDLSFMYWKQIVEEIRKIDPEVVKEPEKEEVECIITGTASLRTRCFVPKSLKKDPKAVTKYILEHAGDYSKELALSAFIPENVSVAEEVLYV